MSQICKNATFSFVSKNKMVYIESAKVFFKATPWNLSLFSRPLEHFVGRFSFSRVVPSVRFQTRRLSLPLTPHVLFNKLISSTTNVKKDVL